MECKGKMCNNSFYSCLIEYAKYVHAHKHPRAGTQIHPPYFQRVWGADEQHKALDLHLEPVMPVAS